MRRKKKNQRKKRKISAKRHGIGIGAVAAYGESSKRRRNGAGKQRKEHGGNGVIMKRNQISSACGISINIIGSSYRVAASKRGGVGENLAA